MRRLTTLKISLTGLLCAARLLPVFAQSPAVSNIRLTVDERAGVVRILYDLSTIRPDDSVSVVLGGARSGRIPLRSVQGDVGRNVKAGLNRSITWDAVKDDVNIDEDVSVIFQLTPTTGSALMSVNETRKGRGPNVRTNNETPTRRVPAEPNVRAKRSMTVPIIGLVAAAGLGGYSASQYLANRSDIGEYDDIPFIESDEDAQTLAEIQARVEARNPKIMLSAIGAGVILAADVVYLMLAKPKPRRTTFNLQYQSGTPVVGFRYKF